jgi:hypothetical protein
LSTQEPQDTHHPVNDVVAPPPTPVEPDERPSRPPRARRFWAILSAALGVVAVISAAMLIVSPSWRATAGLWITAVLVLAAVGAGIVALERRGHLRGLAIAALSVAAITGVATVAGTLPLPDLEAHVYGYKNCPILSDHVPEGIDEDAFLTAFYAPALVGVDTDDAPALSFGTPVRMAPTAAVDHDKIIAVFTAGAPIDVTDAAKSHPDNGAYLAVPVTIEAANDGLGCFRWQAPPSYWYEYGGKAVEFTTVSIPGYPDIEDGGKSNPDGTFTYYDIFDVTPAAAANGGYELDLLEPDGTIKPVYWEAST